MSTFTYSLSKYEDICHDPAFIDFIYLWVNKHITRPIRGFEQKTKADGERMTKKELLSKTHDQIIHAACYFYRRGKSKSEILEIIGFFKQ